MAKKKYLKQFRQEIIPVGRPNRPAFLMKPRFITIHDTSNKWAECTAESYIAVLNQYSDESAWHFSIDSKEIIQHLPLDENAWHCGDEEDGDGNRASIGLELCMNEGGDRKETERKAQELCALLMKQFNIPLENIKQHNDWNDLANCPELLRTEGRWDSFIEGINKYL